MEQSTQTNMADHVRVRSGIVNGPFMVQHKLKTLHAGIGVISMAMAAPNILDN